MDTLRSLISKRDTLFATAAALTRVHQMLIDEGASQCAPLRALTSLNAAQAAQRDYLAAAAQVAVFLGVQDE